MFENLLTKENLTLLGVIALFLWRIVDFILRQKKKRETEFQKLAFEMTKFHFGNVADPFSKTGILPFYFYYLDALENNFNPNDPKRANLLREFEKQIEKKILAHKEVSDKLEAINIKLSAQQDISVLDLWERNFNWSLWFRHTKKLLKKTFSHKPKFHSVN